MNPAPIRPHVLLTPAAGHCPQANAIKDALVKLHQNNATDTYIFLAYSLAIYYAPLQRHRHPKTYKIHSHAMGDF
jgi:hypothetical protein